MAIDLITGQPRNGKTQRVMPMLFDIQKQNDKRESRGEPRLPIYIDVEGINADDTSTHFVDAITDFEREKIWFGEYDDPAKPNGYWCPPYGSYFFFDECHKREWVKDAHGSVSKNPTTISLNEHGHAGHTIVLITQFPQYIHTHIRGLIAQHWHVKRKMGTRWARVYKFDEFKLSPRSETVIKDAFEVENFFFKKKWENAYKSASAHEQQKIKVPMILALPIFALILIAGVVWYTAKDIFVFAETTETETVKNPIDDLKAQNQQQLEQINKIRFELEELKAKYLPKHIAELAEHEDVRPAMIISSSEHCRVYNSHGEALIIADGLCRMMNEYPSMIPKSRQAQRVSDTVPQPSQTFGIGDNKNNNVQVEQFESPRPYS